MHKRPNGDMPSDPLLDRLTSALAEVPGVEAIALGGSQARGTHHAASDHDIGLYFSETQALDTDRLADVARTLVDDSDAAGVTPVGDWGPWIVGGAWLAIEGRKVDLLYRNIEAVARVIAACSAGDVTMHYQPGHPHGFCSAIWMGEVALCRPLHDPRQTIAKLKAAALPYPPGLREALIRCFLWEILFAIENAELAASRGEQTHVAGCAYRAFACLAQVLFALNARYLINEKGALQEAAGFALTIPSLMPRVGETWRLIGESRFATGLTILREIDRDVHALAAQPSA
jgi:predicted nucleotidyltransferase